MNIPKFWMRSDTTAANTASPHATRCWGWSNDSIDDALRVARERTASVAHMVSSDPSCGIRVYRTAAGLRLLLTHSRVPPTADDTMDAMQAFGADPRYMNLCKLQECFRARLTPKPWRCGNPDCKFRYPFVDQAAEDGMGYWLARYQQTAERYATCTLIGHFGSEALDAGIQRVVDYHDQRTGIASDLALV